MRSPHPNFRFKSRLTHVRVVEGQETKDKTYEDRGYWNKVYGRDIHAAKEPVTPIGSDGEREFDERVLKATKGKEVLDLGCGDGRFTSRIAKEARRVVGADFSEVALEEAMKNAPADKKNTAYRKADASRLPFASESFDVLVSRRGPATSNGRTLSEVYRVLKQGGLLMEITIGE